MLVMVLLGQGLVLVLSLVLVLTTLFSLALSAATPSANSRATSRGCGPHSLLSLQQNRDDVRHNHNIVKRITRRDEFHASAVGHNHDSRSGTTTTDGTHSSQCRLAWSSILSRSRELPVHSEHPAHVPRCHM